MQHPSGIPEKIVEKVVARRGRLHAFGTIDPWRRRSRIGGHRGLGAVANDGDAQTLQRDQADVVATKSGASAFFPGKCDLKIQLDARHIDTVLIAGAVTNICCESSARDAAELDYKVIMVSDALAGHAPTPLRDARDLLSHLRGRAAERGSHSHAAAHLASQGSGFGF